MIDLKRAKDVASELILKTETETVIKIEYYDLEKWYFDIFGKDLEFSATQCANNGCVYNYKVEKEFPYHSHAEVEEAEKFIYGDKKFPSSFSIPLILNVLCRDGFLPPGNYVIRVSC